MYNSLKELIDDVVKAGYTQKHSNGHYVIYENVRELFDIDNNDYTSEKDTYRIIFNKLKDCIEKNNYVALNAYVDIALIKEIPISDPNIDVLYSPKYENMHGDYVGSRELIADYVYRDILKELKVLINDYIDELNKYYTDIINYIINLS